MSTVAAFLGLMRQIVTVEPFVSRDAFGVKTYGAAASYRARVVGKVSLVRDMHGQEVVARQMVYLASGNNVSDNDRVTLPAGYVPQQPPIVSVGQYPDETGRVHHTVLFLA